MKKLNIETKKTKFLAKKTGVSDGEFIKQKGKKIRCSSQKTTKK